MRCVLVGNYGVGNLGDDALRSYFLTGFPEIDWITTSVHPRGETEVPRLPAGLRSILGTPWWRTIKAFRHSDAIVFGGGSLFTDVESSFACFLWWLHGLVGVLLGKKIILAFQGIGPFRTRRGEWFARWVVRRSSFISVRDASSAERVGTWRTNLPIVQTFDPVFSLMAKQNNIIDTKDVFIVIPRRNSGESFQRALAEFVLQHPASAVRCLLMQPDDPEERKVIERINGVLGRVPEVRDVRTLSDLMEQISRASFVLTERYHGALAAIALEKPLRIISQGEGDKLWVLERMLKRGEGERGALLIAVQRGEKALRRYFSLRAN